MRKKLENEDSDNDPGFAPSQPTDGRQRGDWKSHYPVEARGEIKKEAIVCSIYLISVLSISIILFFTLEKYSFLMNQFQNSFFLSMAFLGGLLGGTLFSLKWLYHSVAKNIWNVDRRIWRFFTPILSGSLSLVFGIIFLGGDLLNNNQISSSLFNFFGMGFLVGYFSDSALGKLSEVAKVFFGSSSRK